MEILGWSIETNKYGGEVNMCHLIVRNDSSNECACGMERVRTSGHIYECKPQNKKPCRNCRRIAKKHSAL
jgi:hypothetical protein